MVLHRSHNRSLPASSVAGPTFLVSLILSIGFVAWAQAPPAQPGAKPAAKSSTQKPHALPPEKKDAKPISEDELRHRLQGKMFYLRGAYVDDDLRFDTYGTLASSSPRGSYTLSLVEIEKVHLNKHKADIEAIRYGLHFLESGPGEDPLSALDKVRITPKKKSVRISIAREVAVPRKKKSKSSIDEPEPEDSRMTQSDANRILNQALDSVFCANLDGRMVASLPEYWQLFYKDTKAKTNFKPSDPSVLRQSAVDQKARLLTSFQPPSNDFAQNAGVAGVAQYHVVVGPDGTVGEIAIGRPIGFGLDENAVDAIRKATFQPAVKNGRPVPALVDLLVEFRIYSQRTGAPSSEASASLKEPEAPSLPGPDTVNQPATKPQ